MNASKINESLAAGARLTAQVRPFLRREDHAGLRDILAAAWSPDCLELLLVSDDVEIVETAVLCLGFVGSMSSSGPLAKVLQHDRIAVVLAAENALWAIWFRAGGELAHRVLTRIAASLRLGQTENAVPMLTELIREYPDFAEAYHQRAQAYSLRNATAPALHDAKRALELNPLHFGALANQANARVVMGHYQDALRLYREVLRIHPRMPGIRRAIRELRRRLSPVGA